MRILGMDPGSVNYAWALAVDQKIVDHGYLVAVDNHKFNEFNARFIELLDKTQPDEVIFERFQVRGKHSSIAEPINCMLGGIIRICDERGIPWYRVIASQWKNYYKKPLTPTQVKNNETFAEKDANKPERPDQGLKDHEADAGCLTHYLDTYWRERRPIVEAAAEKKRKRDEEKKAAAKAAKKAAKAAKKRKTKRTKKTKAATVPTT